MKTKGSIHLGLRRRVYRAEGLFTPEVSRILVPLYVDVSSQTRWSQNGWKSRYMLHIFRFSAGIEGMGRARWSSSSRFNTIRPHEWLDGRAQGEPWNKEYVVLYDFAGVVRWWQHWTVILRASRKGRLVTTLEEKCHLVEMVSWRTGEPNSPRLQKEMSQKWVVSEIAQHVANEYWHGRYQHTRIQWVGATRRNCFLESFPGKAEVYPAHAVPRYVRNWWSCCSGYYVPDRFYVEQAVPHPVEDSRRREIDKQATYDRMSDVGYNQMAWMLMAWTLVPSGIGTRLGSMCNGAGTDNLLWELDITSQRRIDGNLNIKRDSKDKLKASDMFLGCRISWIEGSVTNCILEDAKRADTWAFRQKAPTELGLQLIASCLEKVTLM